MNILLSANDNYYFPTKVLLSSLFRNNAGERINVYFLYSNMQEYNIKCLKEFVEKHSGFFSSHKVSAEDFSFFPVTHHFSIETYYRFLAQEIVPESEDRILWLDVDMIVKGNLSDFYYQDFEGMLLAVCKSINKNPQEQLSRLGCPEGAVYFNAGTILYNLKELRNNISFADYSNYFYKNRNNILWLDQDILNGVFALKTKVCDYKKYNYQMFADDSFSPEELKYIDTNTVIIHYIGPVKPWHANYKNECSKYWKKYACLLLLSDLRRRFILRLK